MTADDWDLRFLALAREASTWSKDPSTQVGAVLVDGSRRAPVSFGYNGPVRGYPYDSEVASMNRTERLRVSEHAERNAVFNAAALGVPTEGKTLYVTHPPCVDCARAVVQSGVGRVVWRTDPEVARRWDCEEAVGLLRTVGVGTEEVS